MDEKEVVPEKDEESTTNATVTIQLKNGPIIARRESDLIVAEGVKHSEQRRFTPPGEILPWTEPIDCTQPGPLCPQQYLDFAPLGELMRPDRVADENCLTVNVVAPADAREQGPLPVLVWIHGGAYMSLNADLSLYDTRGLARKGVVVVSVQYRLGVFGYARIPGVAPANLGLLDQIAGLKWVQENVTAFGGDPTQVTVSGQSAGADAVYSLLVANGTEGLFHRAVLMSAPLGLFQHKWRRAIVYGKSVKRDGKRLAVASTEEIVKEGEKLMKSMMRGGLISAGFYVEAGQAPLPPIRENAARLNQRASRIPILIGTAKHDVLPFLYMIPITSPLTHLSFVGRGALLGLSRIFTELIFARGAKALHREYLKDGGKSVSFRLDWYPKGTKFRASHCIESPLLFGGYDDWIKTPLITGADREAYERLSIEAKNLVTSFVRGGAATAEHLVLKENYRYIEGKN